MPAIVGEMMVGVGVDNGGAPSIKYKFIPNCLGVVDVLYVHGLVTGLSRKKQMVRLGPKAKLGRSYSTHNKSNKQKNG